jgi:hypothetical protein
MTLELTFGTWRSQTKASVSLFINGIAHPSLNADLILKFHDMTITLLQVSTFLYFFICYCDLQYSLKPDEL